MFRRVSRRFGPRETSIEAGDILVNQSPDGPDTEVARIEDSFNRLVSKVGTLVERSVTLVSRISTRLDKALQKAFLNDTDVLAEESTTDPYNPSRDSGFLQGVGLEEVLDSFFDFGKSVLDEFGAVVTQVFDDIHEAVEEEKKKGSNTVTINILKQYCKIKHTDLIAEHFFSVWCSEGNFAPFPAEQEVVPRPSQADLRVLAAPEPV